MGRAPIPQGTARATDTAPKEHPSGRPATPQHAPRLRPASPEIARNTRPARAFGAPAMRPSGARFAAAVAAAPRSAGMGSIPLPVSLNQSQPAVSKLTSAALHTPLKSRSNVGTAAFNLLRYSPEQRNRTVTTSALRSAPAYDSQIL